MIQWFLLYSQIWAIIITVSFRTFSLPQKETLLAIGSLYPSPPPALSDHSSILWNSYEYNHMARGLMYGVFHLA